MAAPVMKCSACGARNRVPVVSTGRPRCGKCHKDLPWLVDATAVEFNRIIETSSVPVVVDFWAPWCGPCRAVAPALEQLASDRAGTIRVVKVNSDQEPALSSRLGVQGIPTLLLFSHGKEVSRQVGALPAARIAHWVDQANLHP